MLFYYLCSVGEQEHRTAYPQGAQSKDADVFKWVTMYSGSPAVCQREHPGMHRWRPDEGGDEERIVRGYAVLQWDKEGFEPGAPKPAIGDRFESRWGPSIVVERVDDVPTGTYLLRISSPTWVPAQADPAQSDQRGLGVQFGGLAIEN